jgi:hypothetical protein
MTYDEAIEIVAAFTAGIENPDGDWQPSAEDTLMAMAVRDRLEAIRPACAFATIWREDVEKPGFEFPSIKMVGAVEYLINEPICDEAVLRRRGGKGILKGVGLIDMIRTIALNEIGGDGEAQEWLDTNFNHPLVVGMLAAAMKQK